MGCGKGKRNSGERNSGKPENFIGKSRGRTLDTPKEDPGNENNNSMVLRINYGNISWLFTGDMEEEEVMLQQPSQSTPVAPQVSEPKEDD